MKLIKVEGKTNRAKLRLRKTDGATKNGIIENEKMRDRANDRWSNKRWTNGETEKMTNTVNYDEDKNNWSK